MYKSHSNSEKMEFCMSDRYHEVMSHLLMAGIGNVENLTHNLYKITAFTLNDVCLIQKEVSLKAKVQLLLDRVMLYDCTEMFLDALNETLPQVSKALMDQPNGSLQSGSPDLGENRAGSATMQNSHDFVQRLISERDHLSNQVDSMSRKFQDLQNKFSQSQADNASILRQSESDQQELAMIRRRSLMGGGSSSIINQMYERMRERCDEQKLDMASLKQKLNEETSERSKMQNKLDIYMRELSDANTRCESIVREHEQMAKQFMTLNKRNEGLQSDLNRVRAERTQIRTEYSLVMSERDAVLKNIEKLQEEIADVNKELSKSVNEKKLLVDEKEQMIMKINSIQQNKNYCQQSSTEADVNALREELFVAQRERKQALAQYEEELSKAYAAKKAQESAMETSHKIRQEKDALLIKTTSLTAELKEANKESDDAKRLRQVAFVERDQMRSERDELKRVNEKLEEDRERLVKQLEAEMKEHDTTKEAKKRLSKELRGLRDKDGVSQRDENSHSHDSAIDAGDWGSEDLKSLQAEQLLGPCKGYKYISCDVKRPCTDIVVGSGLFIIRSSVRKLWPGERIISINNIIVDSKNCLNFKEELNNSTTNCTVKVARQSTVSDSHDNNNSFSPAIYIPNSPDSAMDSQPNTKEVSCQTNEIKIFDKRRAERKFHRNTHTASLYIPTQAETITLPMRDQLHSSLKQPKSPTATCPSSEADSHLSLTTTSDSTYSSKTNSTHLPRQSSQKSSDSSASYNKKSGKSRFKIPRLKKKSKSQSNCKESPNGGTWPRIESTGASISNLFSGGGGLSVFSGKKRERPGLSQCTFTPPQNDKSIGQTPPTVRGKFILPPPVEDVTVEPFGQGNLPPSPGLEPIAPVRKTRPPFKKTAGNFRRPRPTSAPMEQQKLSTRKENNISNNNNLTGFPKTSLAASSKPYEQQFVTSFSSRPHSSLSNTMVRPLTPSSVKSSISVIQSPDQLSKQTADDTSFNMYIQRNTQPYKRQESAPAVWDNSKMSLPSPVSSNMSPDISSRNSVNLKPKTSTSLPRPSSARPSLGGVSAEPAPHKSRTLDYKRIRIASEVSVGLKLSGSEKGSLSLSSDRSTPIIFTPSHSPPPNSDRGIVLGTSASSISYQSNLSVRGRRPPNSEPRYVSMIKGKEPIGISIVGGGEKGGIFVSRIVEDSLAAHAGLEYGDQLLEYNGINLRSANEAQARVIMSQTHPMDAITFLAQYNLEKYRSSVEINISDSLAVETKRSSLLYPVDKEEAEGTITPETTPRVSPQLDEALKAQAMNQPRYVFLSEGCSGLVLCGGNRYGVYISSFSIENTEAQRSLNVGDKIMEYNGVNMRNVTLERASLLLEKPVLNASFQVEQDIAKFNQIQSIAGDYFFVRALFDNAIDSGPGNLCFTRNTILLVDNTYPDCKVGTWSAWLVDEQGEKTKRGRIPSKITYEKEILPLRDQDDNASCAGSTSGKKLSTTGRRSFFKRKKPSRSSSRSSGEVRMHKAVSETSIESMDTSFDHSNIAYQVVTRHISENRRPVVIFGPHAAQVNERLSQEYSMSFTRCQLEKLANPEEPVDVSVIETYKRANETLALSVSTLKQAMRNAMNRHVLLDLTYEAIDRLHIVHVYPIIIFIDFNSAKKIKESQDRVPGREKLSLKQSKEMLETANNIKKHLAAKYLGTVYIHGGSPTVIANQVRTIVDHEQSKVLWLPTKTDLLTY